MPSSSSPESFDLRAYAEDVRSTVPSYDDLQLQSAPAFHEFVGRLRNEQRTVREHPHEKIIVVMGTGGTFQSADTDHGRAPTGSLKESFDALGLPEDPSIHLKLCDLMNIDSSQATVGQWRFLAEMILHLEQEASDKYDAIIVTHGTDTMARGAAYLSFMLKGFPKSIVFTGSQEPARKRDTDAKDQMERAITTAKLTAATNRRITEVMIACGLRVTRGTWGVKQGDTTTNAFGPWNQPWQSFDDNDWTDAVHNGTSHRLAPALLDYGNGKSKAKLAFANHAIDYDHKGPLEPFTAIEHEADIFPVLLTDRSPVALAQHLVKQRVAVLTQLGSATADNRLVEVALQAAKNGKIVLLQAPFADSSVGAGTYEAGAGVLSSLENIQRALPIINTAPATIEAKANYLLARLGLHPMTETEGLGIIYKPEDLRRFYDGMEQNLVGELV